LWWGICIKYPSSISIAEKKETSHGWLLLLPTTYAGELDKLPNNVSSQLGNKTAGGGTRNFRFSLLRFSCMNELVGMKK
jgi:hypothetical protein